jgi:hypothetical protein
MFQYLYYIHLFFGENALLPYDFENNKKTNKYLYISGGYFIIKKNIALKNFLDENFIHGGGEDLEYSGRLNDHGIIIKCNKFSIVNLLKQQITAGWENEINEEMLNKFIEYCEDEEFW